MVVRLLTGLLLLGVPMILLGQADAGDDKGICKGETTEIGKAGDGKSCYHWEANPADPSLMGQEDMAMPMVSPMMTTTYTLTVVGENFTSKRTDDIGVKVIESVEFKEDASQDYGYDDYTNAMEHWKSVENGKSDPVTAEIMPMDAADQVYFKSTATRKVTVSPNQATATPQTVTCTGVSKGESDIQANCGEEMGMTIKTLKAASYPKKSKSVALRLVNETNYMSTDVPTAALTTYLNNTIYNQAVFEWTVTRLPAKTVAFDLNGDGMLDDNSWMTAEMQVVRDNCDAPGYDHIIFFVDKPTFGGTGFMDLNQKYGFVYADISATPNQTTAHELGHGAWGLMHTPVADGDNVMHPSVGANKIKYRKNQWDLIQN